MNFPLQNACENRQSAQARGPLCLMPPRRRSRSRDAKNQATGTPTARKRGSSLSETDARNAEVRDFRLLWSSRLPISGRWWTWFWGLLLFRMVNAACQQTYFVPDEYWQGPEVAHRM
eukprot:1384776-Rhodomonas_salina.2